jgi:hypothetical protein
MLQFTENPQRAAGLSLRTLDRTARLSVAPNPTIRLAAVGAQGPAGVAGADGVVQSVVAGTNVTVDATDPANPIVSASGGSIASQSEAETGTNNTALMSPLRTRQATKYILPVVYAAEYISSSNTAAQNATGFASLITALGTGGKRVILPGGDIQTNAQVNFSTLENVILEGMGGTDIDFGTTGTQITYTGTGSTTAFNFENTKGITLRDISFRSNQGTYSGTLCSFGCTASVWNNHRIEGCQFYGTTPYDCIGLLYVRNVVSMKITGTRFARAQIGLVGAYGGETATSTALIHVDDCDFTILEDCAVLNPGFAWELAGEFEITSTGAPCGVKHTSNYDVLAITFTDAKFADATAAGTWIQLGHSGGSVHAIKMAGGSFGGDAIANIDGIVLTNAFGVSIDGVLFSGLETAITFTNSCTGVTVSGCSFPNTTNPHSGSSNLDSGSTFHSNNPSTANIGGTGTGPLVRQTSPTLVTPALGVATATSLSAAGNILTSLSQAAQTIVRSRNLNTSTSASAAVIAESNSGAFNIVAANNPNTTGTGGLTWTGSGVMSINASHASGIIDFTTNAFTTQVRVDSTRIDASLPIQLAVYTVATLPAAATGDTAFASNVRVSGEGAGAGTGGIVSYNGTNWKVAGTNTTAVA